MKYGTNAKADYFWSGMALMSETYNAQLNDKSTFQQIVALVIMRARGGEVYEVIVYICVPQGFPNVF